eukprot:NODE_1513_length_1140_cov_191.428048_g1150_i1.p1 GENE.NODE_1513_length_1140_cov_191.428048_g1150_i1~~NODE_1513_length_1140_cov_191.428048_g1150_i1.p1  ORF type:complete len:353 (+),score=103.76 NODE_1513_length_1140_cov_191.428048_g1150_i1:55-1059(+)
MQQYNQQSFRAEHPEDYASRSAKAIPATVRMFSGCMDSQTSADVSNVSSFGLPEGTGPGGAGGACTNAMMLALANNPSPTYIELLGDMRAILSEKGYTQKPELSASHEMDLNTPFVLTPGSRSKSLLVGINYKGMQGELRGCVNDVLTMQQLLLSQGFEGGDQMRILADDPDVSSILPNSRNILESFHWLVEGAQEGDSLFFHYSGHGGQLRDDDGEEKDGMDETIIPLDYQTTGQMRDDTILKSLIVPLPKGVTLTVVMDCCHSGTVLDLPYIFSATDGNMDEAASGGGAQLYQNPKFNLEKMLMIGIEMFKAYQTGGWEAAVTTGLSGFFSA